MEAEKHFYWQNHCNEIKQEDFMKIVSVLTAHKIALWEYDVRTDKCSFSNDYFEILGLDRAGVYFKDLEDSYKFYHPDDIQPYKEAYNSMLASETKMAQILYRCIGSRGEVFWLEDHFLSFGSNGSGQPETTVAYTVNVTSAYEKELQISRLASYNRKIIEALPEFIFIFDRQLIITDVMIPPGTVLFHSAEELKGMDGHCIYSPEVSELLLNNIHACLEDGLLKEIEYPVELFGQRFYYQARIVPFDENRALALIHDIGDRVRRSKELIDAKRRAEEADYMKTVFLANMSHEIRTPLNAIVGFSEIILMTEDEDEKKEFLEIIKKNSNLLLQLINDILDLSRIESGRSEMNFVPVSLFNLLTEIDKVQRLKMPENIQLNLCLPQNDIIIHSDRNRLTQVVFNFMSNAIKNTSEGSITLGVDAEEDWIRIYVADTGCGISEEKLPLIFNRFEKLNDFVQGTGLGLPICKSIVERLGGRIEVQSEVGKGSIFSVCLHLNACTVPGSAGSGLKKILIADESDVSFVQISDVLKSDYEIIWARDGEEAVECFLYDKPDLIIISMNLPNRHGVQVIEKMRKISASVPVVAIAEHSYIEQQQALQAGCNEVITKPFPLERLRNAVELYLRKKA